MHRRTLAAFAWIALAVATAGAQRSATPAEVKQAEHDVPLLVDELALKPGMTAADVGAGFGAMTVRLAKWLGPGGRVFATDIGAPQLAALRDTAAREHLDNVVVIEGAERSSNLPAACCDAIFLRDVYHHFTSPLDVDRSLFAALKPGGRLAVIDFLPRPGTKVPAGVAENRGGHGVPPAIVLEELTAAGLKHVKTIDRWPPDQSGFFLVLVEKPRAE